jgi:hypothetical protein
MPVIPTIAAVVSGFSRAKAHASLVILLRVSPIELRVSLIESDGGAAFGVVAFEAAV